MEFVIKNTEESIHDIVLAIGYQSVRFKKEGKFSMVRSLQKGATYPRFHLECDRLDESATIFRLHFDQSMSRYVGDESHKRQYGGADVKSEMKRIEKILSNA